MKGIRAKIICIIASLAVFVVGIIFQYFQRSYKSFKAIRLPQNAKNLDNNFKIISPNDLFAKINLIKTKEIKTIQNERNYAHININTADIKELEKLYGIGEKMAKRIIDYRNSHGSFEVIEDIMRVNGIGTKTFEKIKNKISVE